MLITMAFGKRYAEPAVYKKNGSFEELQNSYRWMCDPDMTPVRSAFLASIRCRSCHSCRVAVVHTRCCT